MKHPAKQTGGATPDGVNARARALYERILQERQSAPANHRQIGDLIDELRQCLRLRTDEFARAVGVSLSTYNRWRAGSPAPLHRLRDVVHLVHPEPPPRDSIYIGERRLTPRSYVQLMDRQYYCTEFWSFKTSVPYRGGRLGDAQRKLLELLTDPTLHVVFNCVFWGPKNPMTDHDGRDFPALHSFALMKEALRVRSEKHLDRLRGWLVSDPATAFQIGMCRAPMGLSLLVYDQKRAQEKSELGDRVIDIFFEIPLAVYDRDDHSHLIGVEEVRWMELEPEQSYWQWKTLYGPLLDRTAGHTPKIETLAKPFLKSAKEVREFAARYMQRF